MVIILPSHCDGLSNLQQRMKTFDFAKLNNQLESNQVQIFLPKFTIKTKVNLVKPLKNVSEKIFHQKENFLNKINIFFNL